MSRLLCVFLFLSTTSADYWSNRNEILNNEKTLSTGGRIRFKPKELLVNKKLMDAKWKELNAGFLNPEEFLPAQHFFEARDKIVKSEVYKIIQKMPKGGVLHVHDIGMGSTSFESYVIRNITYRDDLYVLINTDNDTISFKFALNPPTKDWVLLNTVRNSTPYIDIYILKKINLRTHNPYETFPDVNSVWKAFINVFKTLSGLLCYRPVFEDYFYNALLEFRADNVNYIEIRGTLPTLYELNGTTHNSVETLGLLKNVADKFLHDYPDFIDIKYIYAPVRFVDNSTMDKYIANFKVMKKLYGDFLVGFDLVGQEDPGKPLSSFVNQLLPISQTTRFYFHAGETNWNGMSTDDNLIDALLLNVTRIGHGYAIIKHPMALKMIKQKNIAIEINPISNQVLNLVKDLRNHPANMLISQNYPIVISSDDPGLWYANALSFDFYETFMGMANSKSDLGLLKKLALNSIVYSSMTNAEKNRATIMYNNLWNKFINDFLQEHRDISVKRMKRKRRHRKYL